MAMPIGDDERQMLSFPYDSKRSEDGTLDRLYNSQSWADYFRQFLGNGVFPNPSTNLRVDSINNSLVLTLRAGSAFIHGRTYVQSTDFQFSISTPHPTMSRRDVVVIRHDAVARSMQAFYIEGTPSATPQLP
ncbi:MAG: hypothetical protein FWF50_00450, partial [Defluviitaleaceae bacterium]|nr:hypothetical protein [Defluviitaleaceae bacterium]